MMDNATAEQPNQEELERLLQARLRRIQAMERFVSKIKAEDFAGLSSSSEKVQFTHKHKSMKKKGGNPPKDYSGIEMFIDLQLALESNDYETALPLYYSIKRMLGYFNW